MNSKIKDANTDFLFEAILQLKSLEECYQFFRGSVYGQRNQSSFPADCGGENAQRQTGLQRYCGGYRRFHRHHQPGSIVP